MTRSTIPQLTRLSPSDGAYYFFGYYDLPAYSTNDRLHLAHRVQFYDRWPQTEDVAEIGILERDGRTFTSLSRTSAWNFQQGSMLQWFPSDDADEILFNVRQDNSFGSCILNIHNSMTRFYPRAVANVDRKGRYALSINFSRLVDFRPVCGYADIVDPWQGHAHPDQDGVYLQDFRDGSVQLVLSLQQIWEFSRQWLPEGHEQMLVNHVTFNPSGTRFVALVRYFQVPGRDFLMGTLVITANIDGSDLRAMREGYHLASHYHWKNDDELMIYADGEQGAGLYLWNDRTGAEHLIDSEFFEKDGHCSYSPDGKHILYDSYPDAERYQHLFLYNTELERGQTLGKLHAAPLDVEIRCDLHPRWNRAANAISVDSTHEGSRQIYELAL